jgi:hypothetical protein
MISRYVEEATLPMFLSGLFQSPPENYHDSESVEIDLERDTEEVAVVITDLSAGANYNEANKFSNKMFVPPVYAEKGAIKAYEMIKRQAGQSPFADVDFMANARDAAFKLARKCENKIRRAIELQASQVLQTGKLTLTDQTGATRYSLDYLPKSSHFPTVGTVWATDGSTGDPIGDIGSLASVIRRDGKRNPNKLTFGSSAWSRFTANAIVLRYLQSLGLQLGQLVQGGVNAAPSTRGQGASYKGKITIDYYEYELWMYDGYYADPNGGTLTPYVGTDKVIMTSDGRLDLSYGGIPLFSDPSERPLSFLPERISDGARGLDLTMNSYLNESRFEPVRRSRRSTSLHPDRDRHVRLHGRDPVSRRNRSAEAEAETAPQDATEAAPADDVEAPADAPAEAETAPQDATEAAPASVYRVCAGMSITSLKGILGAGTTVKPEFLHGGQPAFDHLVSVGVLVAD